MKKLIVISLLFYSISLFSQEPKLKWISAGNPVVVNQFLLSPDGKTLAVFDGNWFIKIYDIESRKIVFDNRMFYDTQIIDFSNDSKSLLISNPDGVLKIEFENQTYTKSNIYINNKSITGKAYSLGTDTSVMVYYDNWYEGAKDRYNYYKWGIQISDYKNQHFISIEDTSFMLKNSSYDNQIKMNRAAALSPNGKFMAISNDSGVINIYDFKLPDDIRLIKQIRTGTDSIITGMIFNSESKILITSHYNGKLKFWDIGGDSLTMEVINLPVSPKILSYKVINDAFFIHFYSPNDTTNCFYKFDLSSNRFIDSIIFKKSVYKSISFDEKFEKYVLYDNNNELIYGTVSDTAKIKIFDKKTIRSISFGGATRDWIINCSGDSLIHFQSKITGEIVKSINIHRSPIKYFKISPEGSKLLVVINNFFQIWDLNSLELLSENIINNYNNSVSIVLTTSFSIDEQSYWVAVNGDVLNQFLCSDGRLIDSIKVERVYKRYIKDIAPNPDGRRLALGTDYRDGLEVDGYHNCYDFLDLQTKKMSFERIEIMYGIGRAYYLNPNDLLVIVEHNESVGQALVWDMNTLYYSNQFRILNNANYHFLYNNAVIGKNIPVVVLFFTNGLVGFYLKNKPDAFYSFDTHMPLVCLSVDEDRSEIYAMCSNGTVKCFDINEILATADVGNTNINDDKQLFYPNPAYNYININSDDYNAKIEIFNLYGKSILETSNNNRIFIGNLASGLYFIKYNDKFYKFIKE